MLGEKAQKVDVALLVDGSSSQPRRIARDDATLPAQPVEVPPETAADRSRLFRLAGTLLTALFLYCGGLAWLAYRLRSQVSTQLCLANRRTLRRRPRREGARNECGIEG